MANDMGSGGAVVVGGVCFRHGAFTGPECPQWPKCAEPPFTLEELRRPFNVAPCPDEDTSNTVENG